MGAGAECACGDALYEANRSGSKRIEAATVYAARYVLRADWRREFPVPENEAGASVLAPLLATRFSCPVPQQITAMPSAATSAATQSQPLGGHYVQSRTLPNPAVDLIPKLQPLLLATSWIFEATRETHQIVDYSVSDRTRICTSTTIDVPKIDNSCLSTWLTTITIADKLNASCISGTFAIVNSWNNHSIAR